VSALSAWDLKCFSQDSEGNRGALIQGGNSVSSCERSEEDNPLEGPSRGRTGAFNRGKGEKRINPEAPPGLTKEKK